MHRATIRHVAAATLLLVLLSRPEGWAQTPSQPSFQLPPSVAMAAGMIKDERYDDAINKLEQLLATKPNDPEALTLLATARIYKDRDYLKGKELFEAAIKQGGGASFFVGHSHEVTVMSVGDPSNYCRGWLHLRKGTLSFVPDSSTHSIELAAADIKEFGRHGIHKKLVHVETKKDKDGKDHKFNFAPRSRLESETLLIIVMHQKLARQ